MKQGILSKPERLQPLLLSVILAFMAACTGMEADAVNVSVTRPFPTVTPTTRVTAVSPTLPPPTDTPPATAAAIPTAPPVVPAGLIYREGAHIFQIQSGGARTELFTLPYTPAAAGELSLSPTGQSLLHNTGTSGDTAVYHFDTGETVILPQDDKTYIRRASWWPARPDLLLLETIAEDIYDDSRYFSSMFVLSDLDGSNWRPIHGRNVINSIALSPDGQTVIFLRDGQPYLYGVDQGETPLDMSRYAAKELDNVTLGRPRWSPDGQKFVWLMDGQKEGEAVSGFAIFDLEQQSARYLYPFANEGSEGWPMTPEWNATGEQLAYVNLGSCVIIVLDVTGNTLFTGDSDACSIENDFWSPDGRWLTYFDAASNTFPVVSAAGQRIRSLSPPTASWSHTWLPDGRLLILPASSEDPQRYWFYDPQTWTGSYFDLPDNAEYLGWLP